MTAVRPATESQRTVWIRTADEWVLTDGETEFTRTSSAVEFSKDSVPAYYSYDRETGQYTVYEQGETHVYETSDALEADWTTIKRPFVPASDLPNPAYDRDSYAILILSEDGSAQLYRDGKTAAMADALETLTEMNGASPPSADTETQVLADSKQRKTEDDLRLDPDDDGVSIFADRYIIEDTETSIPKEELYQTYSAWVSRHGLDGTNNVWFARKLSDHLDVGTNRRRVDGDRVNFYTGIGLTEEGSRLREAADKSEE